MDFHLHNLVILYFKLKEKIQIWKFSLSFKHRITRLCRASLAKPINNCNFFGKGDDGRVIILDMKTCHVTIAFANVQQSFELYFFQVGSSLAPIWWMHWAYPNPSFYRPPSIPFLFHTSGISPPSKIGYPSIHDNVFCDPCTLYSVTCRVCPQQAESVLTNPRPCRCPTFTVSWIWFVFGL